MELAANDATVLPHVAPRAYITPNEKNDVPGLLKKLFPHLEVSIRHLPSQQHRHGREGCVVDVRGGMQGRQVSRGKKVLASCGCLWCNAKENKEMARSFEQHSSAVFKHF